MQQMASKQVKYAKQQRRHSKIRRLL